MTRTALDTSVVVAALLPWLEDNEPARASLRVWGTQAGHRLLLPRTALIQAYSVLTRMPHGRRLSPQDARAALQETFAAAADLIEAPPRSTWQLVDDAVAARVLGGAIHDFDILDCAAAAGADQLLTLNPADFLRFPGRRVRIVEP